MIASEKFMTCFPFMTRLERQVGIYLVMGQSLQDIKVRLGLSDEQLTGIMDRIKRFTMSRPGRTAFRMG